MQQSVLLCISTILDSGNRAPVALPTHTACAGCALSSHPARLTRADYTKMMELVDGDRCTSNMCTQHAMLTVSNWHATDFGKTVFETIKITLVSVRPIGHTAASTS